MPNSKQSEPIDTGTYTICKNDKVLGTEAYQIYKQDNGYLVSGKVNIGTAQGALEQEIQLFTDDAFLPLELKMRAKLGEKLSRTSISFSGQSARVESDVAGKVQSEEITISPGTLILANNTFHHFILFIRHYKDNIGGKQQFPLFPARTVSIEFKNRRPVNIGEQLEEVEHYFVDIDGVIGVNLFYMRSQLVKINIPLQGINAVLQGIPGLECETELEEAMRDTDAVSAKAITWAEEEVRFSSKDNVVLAGTLTVPSKPAKNYPAVLLISGSGAQNRDGDSIGTGGIHYGMFRTIAERLTAKGICILRYDDRGVGASTGNFESAGLSDLTEDARAAVTFLRSHPKIDERRIGLMGLSEGGIIAAMIAVNDTKIWAIVLMGTLANPLDEVLLEQFERFIPSALPEDERAKAIEARRKTFQTLKETQNWDSSDVEEDVRKRIPAERRLWFLEHFALDPVSVVQRVKSAVAILHGSLDVQVDPKAAQVLTQALKDAGHSDFIVKIFDGLDHLFMQSKGRGLSEYADKGRRLDDTFLDFLSNWLQEKLV